jgi:hypothetical protein
MPATTTPFSPGEWTFLSKLLALVAEQLSYKSSTDYPLDANDGNKALACAAIKHAGLSGDWGDEDASWEDYVADVMAEDDQLVTFMDWMAAHLAVRCEALAAGSALPMTEGSEAQSSSCSAWRSTTTTKPRRWTWFPTPSRRATKTARYWRRSRPKNRARPTWPRACRSRQSSCIFQNAWSRRKALLYRRLPSRHASMS